MITTFTIIMKSYFLKIFCEHFSYGLLIPVSVIWLLSRDLSLLEVALLQSITSAATFILEIPTGIIADRFGRKTSIVLGLLSHSISLAFTAFAPSFFYFFLGALAGGLGWSLLSGAEEAFVFDTLKEKNQQSRYKKIYGKITMIDEASTMAGLLCTSLIIKFFGMETVYPTATIIMFMAAIISLVLLREPRTAEDTTLNPQRKLEKNPKKFFRESREYLKKHRGFIWIIVLFALLNESSRLLWPLQLLQLGFTATTLGLIYAALKIFAFLGAYLAGKTDNAVSKSHFFILGIMTAVGFLAMALPYTIISLAGFALYFCLENMTRIWQSDFINQRIESRYRATFLSTNNLVSRSFGAVYTLLLGLIAQFALSLGFIVSAVVKLKAAIISRKIIR